MALEDFNIQELQKAIAESNAGWEAGETPFTDMSSEERSLLLGYTPSPSDPSLEESERIVQTNFNAFMAGIASRSELPKFL